MQKALLKCRQNVACAVGRSVRAEQSSLGHVSSSTGDDGSGSIRNRVIAESSRMSPVEASAAYAQGEGPDSFYLPDYLTRMITLDDFDAAARDAAVTTRRRL